MPTSRHHRFLLCLVAAVAPLLLGAGRSDAQPPPAAASAPIIGDLPANIDVVIAVSDLARLRASPLGESLRAALGEAGLLAPIADAWTALAAQLKLSEQEAFDRLLGAHAVLVLQGIDREGPVRWVLLSDVAAQTSKRLRERLESAPRSIVHGHPILSVERGRFELAVLRAAPPQGKRGGGADRVTIALGPAGGAGLFDEMLEVYAAESGVPLSATPALARAAELGPGNLLVMLRLDEAEGAAGRPTPRGPWSNFLVVVGGPEEAGEAGAAGEGTIGVTARLALRDLALAPALAGLDRTSDGPFRAWREGAVFAALENRLPEAKPEPAGAEGSAWGAMGGVLSVLQLPDKAQTLLGTRHALVVQEGPGSDRLSVTLAFETRSAADLAPVGDAHLAGLVRLLETTVGQRQEPVPNLRGVAPGAMRILPLNVGRGGSTERILGSRPSLCWAYPAAPQPGGGGAAGAAGGWWVLSVVPSDTGGGDEPERSPAPAVKSVADTLLRETPGARVRRWVSLGVARPARLAPLLPDEIPAAARWREALGRVEMVTWEFAADDAGDIEGLVRLVPAPPAR